MNKKLVLVSVILLVLTILGLLFTNLSKPKYSDDPKDWVVEKTPGIKEINVEEITKGSGYYNDVNQQFDDGKIATVFAYDGLYKGNVFRNIYRDAEGNVLMEITPELKDDGILQGLIVETIEGADHVVYIFVDEDWREQFGDINILWGKEYQFEKKFSFNYLGGGVYMDTLIDDPERFTEDFALGGIAVGNLGREDIENNNIKGLTVMSLH